MTEILKNQIEFADQIARCRLLLTEVGERLNKALSAADAEAARLHKDLRGANGRRKMGEKPRVAVGDRVGVVRYEYEERGDFFEPFYEEGTVIRIGADDIEVQMPEQSIPAQTVPGRVVRAEWRECSEEWAYDA